ncbi:hypothetical protein [Pelosinus sp. UFO1]|nr:hypothetical protein [Pelosinus sp. UFO1]
MIHKLLTGTLFHQERARYCRIVTTLNGEVVQDGIRAICLLAPLSLLK